MISIAFYKHMSSIVDTGIRFLTNGHYSHCEFVFNKQGTSFSADAKTNICQFFNADHTPNKWDMVHIDGDAEKIFDYCAREAGSEYDYIGILRFLIPSIGQSETKWFCSELCVAGLQTIGLLPTYTPHNIHPNKLYKILKGKAYAYI